MTTQQPLASQPDASKRAVLGKSLASVFGAGWIKSTGWRQQRRDEFLVNPNQKNQHRFHGAFPNEIRFRQLTNFCNENGTATKKAQ
jgi:hypothetical protein